MVCLVHFVCLVRLVYFVYLVYLVCLVYSVYLVCLVFFITSQVFRLKAEGYALSRKARMRG